MDNLYSRNEWTKIVFSNKKKINFLGLSIREEFLSYIGLAILWSLCLTNYIGIKFIIGFPFILFFGYLGVEEIKNFFEMSFKIQFKIITRSIAIGIFTIILMPKPSYGFIFTRLEQEVNDLSEAFSSVDEATITGIFTMLRIIVAMILVIGIIIGVNQASQQQSAQPLLWIVGIILGGVIAVEVGTNVIFGPAIQGPAPQATLTLQKDTVAYISPIKEEPQRIFI